MATLPQQVRDQIQEANRIAEEITGKPSEPENEVEASNEPEVAATETFEGQPPVVEEVASEGEPVAQEAEAEAEPTPTPTTPEEDPNSDTYKQRWKTLDGMMQAEARKNRELSERIVGLENMLARMQELKAKEPQTPAETPKEGPKSLLSQEEVEDYGSELIDVMKRAAQEAVQGELDSIRAENNELKRMLGGVGQKLETSDKDKFFSQLGDKVSNWEQLNKDPGFNGWLDEYDVYAGAPRRGLLMQAFQANDVERVARFFQGFMNETAAVAEVASGQQPPQAPPASPAKPSTGKVSLDSLAAPGVGSSGSADNTSQSSGRMWKESEIASFYEDSRKGVYKGRDTEYKKVERQIQTALTRGNILLGQ
jgi:hypothetical protein